METFRQRLKRYLVQDELEIFGWLAVYLQNSYATELSAARKAKRYISAYLLSHAVIQMVAENMFAKSGIQGTKFFLENFVDGTISDTKFSLVSEQIHSIRNVIAHQGYASLQHQVEYLCDDIGEGWKKEAGTLYINPAIYARQIEDAVNRQAYIPKYKTQTAEERLITKYCFIRKWLKLDRGDQISQEIKKLEGASGLPQMLTQAAVVNKAIYARFGIK